MTENEAIEKIKDLSDMGFQSYRYAKKMAISALKEIQQYREIGTVEECRADAEKRNPLDMDVCPMGYDSCVDGCEEYDEEW